MMKKIKLIAIGVMAISIQSCSSVASVGAGMGLDRTLFETEAHCKQVSYPQYVKDMQVFNNATVDQHQTPEYVETMEEYCHVQKTVTSNKSTELSK